VGTEYDPNAPGTCNCAKIITPTPLPAPVRKDRSPSSQGGPNKPVCRFVCLPGTAHDPNGPQCNCNLITTTPAPATSVLGARDALPSFHCNIVCETPGYHTSPNGCSCIKDAPAALDKRDPLTGRKCALVCAEPGYHTSPNGCGCVKDTTPSLPAAASPAPVKRQVICEIVCATGYHLIPPCKCVKNTNTPSIPAAPAPTPEKRGIICRLVCAPGFYLIPPCKCVKDTETPSIPPASTLVPEKRDGFTKRRCQIICDTPGFHNSPTGCGCVPDSPV